MTQTPDVAPFLDAWRLDPTQSAYERGQPPPSGLYRIEADGESLKFTAEWVDAEGQARRIVYQSVPDGREHAYENLAVADSLTTTLVDAVTLDTTTHKGGQVIAHARRVLSADGQSLTVMQSFPDGRGGWFRNVAVYRRVG